MKFYVVLLFYFLLQGPCLRAQEFSYVNYNTRDGLAGSVVYCMLQDSDGFIWFGTESGLSRFDGTRFTNFTMADGLPDNEILKLFTDSKGRIWIVPFKNSLCYYLHGKIYTPKNDSLLKKIRIDNELTSIIEDEKGAIVIVGRFNMTIVKKTGEIKDIDRFENSSFTVAESGKDTLGRVIVAIKNNPIHFYLCVLQNDKLVRINTLIDSAKTDHNQAFFSPHVYLWSRPGRFEGIDNITGKHFSLPKPTGSLLVAALNDSIFAISAHEMVKTYNFRKQQDEYIFFTKKSINGVMEDREGNRWFSSLGDGVFRLASIEFKNLQLKQGENRMPVLSLLKTKSELYIGTDGYSIWKYGTASGRLTCDKLKTDHNQGRIATLDTVRGGGLLAGTGSEFWLLRGRERKKFGSGSVKSVFISGNEVYAATGSEALSFPIDKPDQRINTFYKGRATAIFKQGDSVFFGTLNGVYVKYIHSPEESAGRYLGDYHDVFRDRVTAILEDKSGVLWMATYGGSSRL